MKFIPHDYQEVAIDWAREKPYAGLFLDMGLGKTVVTLTVIEELLYDFLEHQKVLVIAPKKVAEDTWSREIAKWQHTRHLRISKVLGTPAQRRAALKKSADVYTINRENVVWLVEYLGEKWDFDMVVVDELSSFKSHRSKRFRALRKVRPKIKRLIGLTGTPKPNGYMDLWSQIYLLDRGERLGKTITQFRREFFDASYRPWGQEYKLKPGAAERINTKIADICISMKAKDHLNLKEPLVIDVPVQLTDKEREIYRTMERESIIEIADDVVVGGTAATVSNKLLQLANGAVYDENRNVIHVHDQKLDKLEELLEEADGRNVLLLYSYKHDRNRILERVKGVRELEGSQDIADWNAGKIPVLLAHPGSCGHGLNIQDGGNIIIWFGLPWSLELYLQANARLDRQGQTHQVIIYRLITEGTYDEDVAAALERKDSSQEEFLASLKARIKQLHNEYKEAKN